MERIGHPTGCLDPRYKPFISGTNMLQKLLWKVKEAQGPLNKIMAYRAISVSKIKPSETN